MRICFYCLLCILLSSWPQTALRAVEPIRIELELTPDIDNGRQRFRICARCHLPEAWGSRDGGYPQLAGQHVKVLIKQVLDIRDGRRANPAMRPFVQQRVLGGNQDLVDVVAYIATLPMNPEQGRGPWPPGTAEYREGEKLYAAHCAACHGVDATGDNAAVRPRLQGQHYAYLRRQTRYARDGLRDLGSAMADVLSALSGEQLDKTLNYVSHLPVPPADLAPGTDWRNPDFD